MNPPDELVTRDRRLSVLGGVVMAGLGLVTAGACHHIAAAPAGLADVGPVLLWWLLACGAYLTSLRVARDISAPVWLVLAIALSMRLAVAPRLPVLSTDLYRYTWDGLVQVRGMSPYAWSPNAIRRAGGHDELWQDLNHRDAISVYPPFSQLVFGITAHHAPANPLALKLVLCAFEFVLLLLVVGLGRRCGAGQWGLVAYAWHPLPVVEVWSSGHQDVIGIALIAAAFLLWKDDAGPVRRFACGLATGLAIMTKAYALLAAPFLARRGKSAWWGGMAAGAVGASAPYWRSLGGLVAGTRQYAAQWEGNGCLYPVVHAMLQAWDISSAGVIARCIMVCLLLVVIVVAVRQAGSDLDGGLHGAAWVWFAALLLSPVVYPWYLLWLCPWLAMTGSRAMTAFTIVAAAAYAHYTPMGDAWLWPPAYAAVLLAAIVDWRRGQPVRRLSD